MTTRWSSPNHKGGDEGEHGSYRRWLDGCCCSVCLATIDATLAAYYRNDEPHGRLPVDLYLVGAEHGTASGRDAYGCGCEPCCVASSANRKAKRNQRQAG